MRHNEGLAQIIFQHRTENKSQNQRSRSDIKALHKVTHKTEQNRGKKIVYAVSQRIRAQQDKHDNKGRQNPIKDLE